MTPALGVEVFVVLLGGALLVAVFSTRLRIPYTVALVLVGLPLSPEISHFGLKGVGFAPTLLFVFLPALLFEAAWNLHVDSLRRMWRPIAMLAVPGVLITAGVIATGNALAGVLPFAPAFLLGAILSATDPVAVIATFRRLAVPTDLATLVDGESLANDGVAIVLYTIAIGMVMGTSTSLGWDVGVFLWQSLGGVLIGLLVAYAVAALLNGLHDDEAQIVATVVLAYGAFLIADHLKASGVFAVIAAGITLRALVEKQSQHGDVEGVRVFWGVLAFIANSIVFLEVGIQIEFPRILHEPLLVAVTLAAVIVARLVLAYGLLPLTLPRGVVRPLSWEHIVAYAGLRGALGLALAFSLPEAIPQRPQIIDAVFAVVLVTLVVQGWTIEPLIKRLRPV